MKIKRSKLNNGSSLTTICLNDVVSTYFLILSRSGPRFDPKDKTGLSHFVEHLFCKGTKKYPVQNETLKRLEKLGISTGAFSYQESNMYWSKSFYDDWQYVIDVQLDRFINPDFKKNDIDNEKKIIQEEIQIIDNNHESLIWEEWAKNVWQGSSLGRTYIGDKKTVNSFSKKDVINFFEKNYLANETHFILCGKVDNQKCLNFLNEKLKIFKKSDKNRNETLSVVRKDPIRILRRKTNNLTVAYGFLTVSQRHKDAVVLEIIGTILGSGWGSLLRKNIYDLGLTYSIETYNRNLSDTGYQMTLFTCDKNNLNNILSLINRQIKIISEGKISKDELLRAKGYMKGLITFENEKPDDLANWIGYQEINNFKSCLTPEERCEEIDKIRMVDVVRVVKKYFVSNNWYLSIIGSIEKNKIKVTFV